MNVALHAISLCTGLGGIERGLELAAPGAFEPVLYCERELSSAAIIAKEIEGGGLPAAPIWSDVKTLTRGSVARYLDRVGVDCITGGYPCQPFSVAGKRLGEDDERHLWPHIAYGIEQCRPEVVSCENVEGIISSKCGCCGNSVLHHVLAELESMGYTATAGIFSAEEVGAPHKRKRVFILANSMCKGLPRFMRPDNKHEKQEVRQGKKQSNLQSVFPSYCGEPQFQWESPRTFASDVDGTINGASSPMDRLRLLGNGVVPQTACKAWIELNKRLNK